MIPKIIHLCWLSGDPYPAEIQKCLDGYLVKHKKEDVFTDILNHIYLDVEDALYEAFELSGGRL